MAKTYNKKREYLSESKSTAKTILSTRTPRRSAESLKTAFKTNSNITNMTTKRTAKKATKQKNPKYRVLPGLSITGHELRSRIKNNSITLQEGTDYSLDETYTTASRLSKNEVLQKARENQEQINRTKENLENSAKQREKDAREKERKELEELRKLNKQ